MRRRLPLVLGLLVAAVGLLMLVSGVASARTAHQGAAKVTVITVTAGKPSELRFTLSKSSKIPVGLVTFKVTNRGLVTHDFKICLGTVKAATANACVGKTTPMLAAGKSATLTATLTSGLHLFLCTVPGHAAAGMKGLLGVGLTTTVPSTSVTGSTSSSTGSTSSGSSSGSTGGGTAGGGTSGGGASAPTSYPAGNAGNGKTIFNGPGGCGGCHAFAAAGTPAGDGPALDGTNLSVSAVESQVAQGGAGMPGYTGVLTAQQIADVATFVSQNST
jgi:mono/diheme cytochrome c family protein/uncharacterized cupredoxin-like copper-binding protein